jgi:hypothetical protein
MATLETTSLDQATTDPGTELGTYEAEMITALVDGMKTMLEEATLDGMNEIGTIAGLSGNDVEITIYYDEATFDGMLSYVKNGTVNSVEAATDGTTGATADEGMYVGS